MLRGWIAFTSVFLTAPAAWALDVDCSTPAAVQSAIDAAASGETLSCTKGGTWDSGVQIPNTKGITLDGKGVTITRGGLADKSSLIGISTHAADSTRITGFTLMASGPAAGYFIGVGGGFANAKFRIDHSKLVANDMSTSVVVGAAWGLIDHCDFSANDNAEQIHNEARGASDASGWSEDVTPGSEDALYIEDCTFANSHLYDFSGSIYFWGNSAVQSYYGARTVFRYNALTMSQIDQHGTAGMIGARWWEIYENTFNVVANGNQSEYIVLRAGSGVVFDNHQSGTNLGGGSIKLYEEDSGYPALYQVGRGKDQALYPAYVWNNDASMPVGSGSSNVQEGRDYYLSARPGYTPLAHPHPLANGGSGGAAGAGTGGSSGGVGGSSTGGASGSSAGGASGSSAGGSSSGGAQGSTGGGGGSGAASVGGVGGSAASGGAGTLPAKPSEDSSGCGCRVASRDDRSAVMIVFGLAIAALLRVRRLGALRHPAQSRNVETRNALE